MRALIQRVTKATVNIENKAHSTIGCGLLVLLGIEEEDSKEDIEYLARKIANLRLFEDEKEVMNLSLLDIDGELLVVSQFTLHANTKKGNRPSYIKAAKPDTAIPLYTNFVVEMNKTIEKPVKTGVFGADMQIELTNDGPVTIWIDSKER